MRASCVVLAIALTGCLADKLLLWPPKPQPADRARREVVPSRDGLLEVFIADSRPGTEPAGYVLCLFGNAELANDAVADEAALFGGFRIEFWGVNYPGFGGSEGSPTLDGVARAARAGYDAIARRAHGRPIVVFGSSLGAAAALGVAAQAAVVGVVLHNPPPLPELILRRYGWWNAWLVALPIALQIPAGLDSVPNAMLSTAPALFISSLDDRVVPIAYQERVTAAYAGAWELLAIPHIGHNDPLPAWALAKLVTTVVAWIPHAT